MNSTPEGNQRLTNICLLFAEVHLQRPVEEDELHAAMAPTIAAHPVRSRWTDRTG